MCPLDMFSAREDNAGIGGTAHTCVVGETPALGLRALLSAALVLSTSLWRLINDVIQTRQIRALRRKIVKRVLPHPA